MEQTMIPDTHSFVKDMAAAGMPEPVAEAFVKNYSKHLVGNLATKQDIEDLRKDTAVIIAKLETKLSTALAETKTELIKWNFAASIGVGGLVVALIKLL